MVPWAWSSLPAGERLGNRLPRCNGELHAAFGGSCVVTKLGNKAGNVYPPFGGGQSFILIATTATSSGQKIAKLPNPSNSVAVDKPANTAEADLFRKLEKHRLHRNASRLSPNNGITNHLP